MKLLLTGTTPAWTVLLLVGGVSAFTLWVYRKHALPRPWSVWLPLLRMLSMCLLVLTLLQPVLSRVWTTDVRGRIPVLVDDSGSMAVTDNYTPGEQVRIGWYLGLYRAGLRNARFDLARGRLARVAADAAKRVRDTKPVLAASGDAPGQQTQIKHAAAAVSDLADEIRDIASDVVRAARKTDYLQQTWAPPETRGRISYERYDGIEGWEVNQLLAAPSFPHSPDQVSVLQGFSIPAQVADSYGGRIRGWLYPPETGEYTFWFSSDDQGQLYLSDSDSPDRKRLIAQAPLYTDAGDYSRYPEQKSAPIQLEQGRRYYVEALFKENIGGDHCSVMWERPDGTREDPIPGACLSPILTAVARAKFHELLGRAAAAFEASAQILADAAETLRGLNAPDGPEERGALAKQARDELDAGLRALEALQGDVGSLAETADECLAECGPVAVAEALGTLRRMNRLDIVRRLLEQSPCNLRGKLQSIGDVELFAVSDPGEAVGSEALARAEASHPSSRLGSALYRIGNRYGKQPVAGIVLLSDGNSNAGKSFPEVKEFLQERGIPVFGCGVGSRKPPVDIGIERVLAPTTSFKGDQLQVTAVLRRHGCEGRIINLRVSCGDEVVLEKSVEPGPEATVRVDLSFVEESDGFRHYRVVAEPFPDETLETNNTKTFSSNILTDPVRALLVDEFPRWETRYANMMLKRDPRIDVTALFPASTADGRLQVGAAHFPSDRPGLFAYHILVLGDVDPRHFSSQQLSAIREFVVQKGGTLILMAGRHFMPARYRGTSIAELFPFKVRPEVARSPRPTGPVEDGVVSHALQLTNGGLYENAVQISRDAGSSAELWQRLPGLDWVKDGVFPSANADVFVEAVDVGAPVVLMAYAGLGKILYLGSDSFWRWRYRARWEYHHRFWGQILLWATLGRTAGDDRHVKLITDRPEYSPGETVTLKARVLGTDDRPLEAATVSAQIVDAAGEAVRNVRFTHLPDSGGEYRAKVPDLPKGEYHAVPHVEELADVQVEADYPFAVRDLPTSEYIELSLNGPELKALATEYRHFLDADDLLEHVPRLLLTEEHRKDYELWDSFWMLFVVAALLAVEWQLRKQQRLV